MFRSPLRDPCEPICYQQLHLDEQCGTDICSSFIQLLGPLSPFEAMDGDLQLPPNYFFSGSLADKFGRCEEQYQTVQSALQKVYTH